MPLTGGEIVVEALIRAGVPYAVGAPGAGVLGLQDAFLGREDRIRVIRTVTDAAAVYLADGYFRVSGRPLAAFTAMGAPASSTATGLATAYVDSSAVLCITGAPPTYLVGKGLVGEVERGRRGHAFPDVLAPIVKRQWCVTSPPQLATVMQRAFTEMRTGRPGPVHIDLPADVQADAADVRLPDAIDVPDAWVVPPPGDIERAAQLLRQAVRPVILAGGGVLQGRAAPALRALAEAVRAPVATTRAGRSAFPDDHPLALGLAGVSGTMSANAFCSHADVLLAVGCRFTDYTASSYRHEMTFAVPPTEVIQVDMDPREIGKNYPAAVGLVGDARRTLDALGEAYAEERPASPDARKLYAQEVIAARTEWADIVSAWQDDAAEPAVMASVVAELRDFMDEDGIVVTSSGSVQAHVLQQFPFSVPGTNVTAAGLRTPGFALPAAMGAMLAAPGRQVLAVCGDGDFLESLPELATAVAENIPVVALVCNNGGYQGTRAAQVEAFGADRAANAAARVVDDRPYSPDIAALADAFGCHAQRVDSADELQTALAAAFASGQPAVVECRVAPASPGGAGGWHDVPVPAYLADRRADYERARAEQRV